MTNLISSFCIGVLLASIFEHGFAFLVEGRRPTVRKPESAVLFWCIAGVFALASAMQPFGLIAAVPVAVSHIDLTKRQVTIIGCQSIIRNIGTMARQWWNGLDRH